MRIFAVQDMQAEAYLPPFTFGTVGQAIRAMADAMQKPDHPFARHSEDYVLWQVGTFDEVSGKVVGELGVIGPLTNFRTEGVR